MPTRVLETALARGGFVRDRPLFCDLVRLQPLEDLVDDLPRLELARTESDVEVLGLLEAGLSDDLGEDARALKLPVRQLLGLERLIEELAALRLGLAARLALVPLPDLVPRA